MDKEVSTILKGYLYPSMQVTRCPFYHRCLVTGKCQNYDPHQVHCSVCETRVVPPGKLGGILPEGKYVPDLQDAIRTMEIVLNKAYANRESRGQILDTEEEITNKQSKIRKSTEMIKMFMDSGFMKMEEKIVDCLYDLEKKKILGRL